MKTRLTAIIAAAGIAAVGAWYKSRSRRRSTPVVDDEFADLELGREHPRRIEIDDDTAAEIIRRAKPALEIAREAQ
jgi:hypothetical protein